MNSRKIAALRNLAERPGTEAEGKLAKQLLDRLESDNQHPPDEAEAWITFTEFLRSNISTEDYLERMRQWAISIRNQPLPTHWRCACGALLEVGGKCEAAMNHLLIQQAIREKFAIGDRVLYSRWAYPPNCPGRVAAYVKTQKQNNDYPWAWLSIKFDHLKQARQVPIYSASGWDLAKVTTISAENPSAEKRR